MTRPATAALAVFLLLPVAGAGQDREMGAPVVFEGPFALPWAIAVGPTPEDPSALHAVVAEVGARRVLHGDLPPDGGEPAWVAPGSVPEPTAPDGLSSPQGVALSPDGRHLYVADAGRARVLAYRWDPALAVYSEPFEVAPDGPASGGPLVLPRDLAVDARGRIHVLDGGTGRLLVADGPAARRFTLLHAFRDVDRPHGLDVAGDGSVWIADTGHHRILRWRSGSPPEVVIDRYGGEGGGLREPRDVAIGPDGRIYVADAWNHRVAIYDADGTLHRTLGSAPLLGRPERLAFDPSGRLHVVDPQNGWIVVWPGIERTAEGGDAARFDVYLRDHPEDHGDEPSAAEGERVPATSPDVLVRYRDDLDVELAQREGLALVGQEVPLYGRVHALYFEVHNRGSEPFSGGALGVWQSAPGGATGRFPEGWTREPFYRRWESEADSEPGNLLPLDFVAPGGRAVLGPLYWRTLPEPAGGDCHHGTHLLAAIVDLHEPMARSDDVDEEARRSNDVARRVLPLIPPRCVPEVDRYEENDRWSTGAWPEEDWQHLHARCPRTTTRRTGDPYPDTECPGVFEDGVAPREAEEIWRLTIPDLSLHSTTDRDFFFVPLPRLSDPRWRLDDIRPESRRVRFPADREAMPECGAVERTDFGPAGRDNSVFVNVTTELVVTAEPVANAVAERPVETAGERLRLYRDGEEDPALGGSGTLVKRVVCPAEVEGLAELELSFGERRDAEGAFEPRPLTTLERDGAGTVAPLLGGYELRFEYVSTIDRGIPEWARSFNDERGVRRTPCNVVPGWPGGRFGSAMGAAGFLPAAGGFASHFPLCGLGLDDLIRVVTPHPQTPGLPCIADGPGCLELSFFDWPASVARLDLELFAPRQLAVRLLDLSGQEVARAQPTRRDVGTDIGSPIAWPAARLLVDKLPAGRYFLEIEGPPTTYAIEYRALSAEAGDGGDAPPGGCALLRWLKRLFGRG